MRAQRYRCSVCHHSEALYVSVCACVSRFGHLLLTLVCATSWACPRPGFFNQMASPRFHRKNGECSRCVKRCCLQMWRLASSSEIWESTNFSDAVFVMYCRLNPWTRFLFYSYLAITLVPCDLYFWIRLTRWSFVFELQTFWSSSVDVRRVFRFVERLPTTMLLSIVGLNK